MHVAPGPPQLRHAALAPGREDLVDPRVGRLVDQHGITMLLHSENGTSVMTQPSRRSAPGWRREHVEPPARVAVDGGRGHFSSRESRRSLSTLPPVCSCGQ